jgi:hypothetical protein
MGGRMNRILTTKIFNFGVYEFNFKKKKTRHNDFLSKKKLYLRKNDFEFSIIKMLCCYKWVFKDLFFMLFEKKNLTGFLDCICSECDCIYFLKYFSC